MLALYYDLFPRTVPRLRNGLHTITAFTTVFAVTTFCLDTFWCGVDLPINWSLDDGSCISIFSITLFNIDWVLNIVSDLSSELGALLCSFISISLVLTSCACLVFVLPFFMLRHLQLGPAYNYGLVMIFALGFLTIVASCTRFVVAIIASHSSQSPAYTILRKHSPLLSIILFAAPVMTISAAILLASSKSL